MAATPAPAPAPEPLPEATATAPETFPDAPPLATLASPPPARRRGLVVTAAVLGAVLVLGGIGAALYFNVLGGKGGSVTEDELRAALASFTSATGSEGGSNEAFGIEGTVSGSMEEEDFPTEISATFRMMHDPTRNAYELSYRASGSGITVEMGVKQVGNVINYVQAPKTYVGRDEDPSTLPSMGELDEVSQNATFGPGSLLEEELVIESREGVRHNGEPATKFTAHAREAPEERGTITVYDDSLRVARVEFTSEGMTVVMDVLYGKEVDIDVSTDHDRASFVVGDQLFGGYDGGSHCDHGSTGTSATCTIPEEHVQEVKLSDVELRAIDGFGSESPVVASLRADAESGESNGVRFTYDDVDGDGLLSAGDRYSYDFGERFLTFQFYDLWADKPAGGPGFPMPGFELLGLVAALGVGVVLLRRRPR